MKPVILIVDDEPVIRQLLTMLLELNGYSVQEAVDGFDALDKVQEYQPDVMILDLMMPKLDGLATCKKVRNNLDLARLPIIMLSGKSFPEAEKEGLAAGANYFMGKPMDMDELLVNIDDALAKEPVWAIH